ncbi:AAA family ATPase [Corallococcus sicarius]|uniref:AAA family ATPase n=1 Tax=Corallococcus sicarius TaxID=2316726 RepID=A0A3A8NFP3_9BACT|nr:ATP-binding protein [Corallococcus sicarius]RKH42813.1 AAA family ATPase [Corallococcus sicarius]
MYIKNLKIQNLKLLKNIELPFTNSDGSPRMWTVIIGENGTGKTSILQAIAMASAGQRNVTGLAENIESLRDKRAPRTTVQIEAEFILDATQRKERLYPGYPGGKPPGDVVIQSHVRLNPKQKSLEANSNYLGVDASIDPIDQARSLDAKLWFVAAYGIHRNLPDSTISSPRIQNASIDRLRPIFKNDVPLIGTAFANVLTTKKRTTYARILRDTLFGAKDLLPGFKDLELRGKGGANSSLALQERHRFIQDLPSGNLKLAANWLSHGYQSTIAWIADLVGQILYESKLDNGMSPKEMEGLVLIDELDLYLHPKWQRTLIQTLKRTFPKIQFVATTHSPLALVGLRPDEDEIIRLAINKSTGNVQQYDMKNGQANEPDPRLMTGTEIYQNYFGINQFYPDNLGDLLRRHRFLAANPFRSDKDEIALDQIEKKLREEGVDPDFERTPRENP